MFDQEILNSVCIFIAGETFMIGVFALIYNYMKK